MNFSQQISRSHKYIYIYISMNLFTLYTSSSYADTTYGVHQSHNSKHIRRCKFTFCIWKGCGRISQRIPSRAGRVLIFHISMEAFETYNRFRELHAELRLGQKSNLYTPFGSINIPIIQPSLIRSVLCIDPNMRTRLYGSEHYWIVWN